MKYEIIEDNIYLCSNKQYKELDKLQDEVFNTESFDDLFYERNLKLIDYINENIGSFKFIGVINFQFRY